MQVVEHRSELDAAIEHFLYSKRSIFPLPQVSFERFTLKEVHDEIPALVFNKIIVDAWEVGMNQACQRKHLAPAGFDQLLRIRVILAYFLEGYHAFAELRVLRLIHGAHLICTYHLKNTVALLHDDIGEKQTGKGICCKSSSSWGIGERLATGKAMRGLCRISRATRLTIHRGRNVGVYTARHTCTVPSSLPEAIYCPSGDHVTDIT